MVFYESAMLVQLWRKRLPDLEDDLQGFPNEEFSKSEILNMACAIAWEVLKTETKITLKNVEKVMPVKWCSSTTGTVHAAVKHKRKEEGREDESEIHIAMRSLNNLKKCPLQIISQNKCQVC